MFYPIITNAYVFREGSTRDFNETPCIFQNNCDAPTPWDYFLLHFGDLLIGIGKKVRNGSACTSCSESGVLHTDTSRGNA